MKRNSRIFVAGHRGLVGSALVRQLRAQGYQNLITRSHDQLDLTWRAKVMEFFTEARPEYVFLAAARVGGVCSNAAHEADFLLQNLEIQNNVISGAHLHGATKLLFFGSSCIYPRLAKEPVQEDSLLTGALELSNEWYAISKIAGLKLCQAYRRQYGCDFISVMPTNLFGLGDKYDLTSSHVLPALLRKFHEAKLSRSPSVTCWGTGNPTREFLYADDLADGCITLMKKYSDESPINIGTGKAITIYALAGLIATMVGFEGEIYWDVSKPDGTPRRSLDGSKMKALGWAPKTSLSMALARTYEDYMQSLTPPELVYDSMR